MDTAGKEGEETKAAIAVEVETKSSEIPLDIVHDILVGLSVKFLLRFKTVCKSWCSLISDPEFIKSHLRIKHHNVSFIHLSRDQEEGPRIYIDRLWPTVSFTSIVNSEEEASLEIKKVEIDYPFKYSSRFHNVVLGSCNGLLLLASSSNQAFLWNPSTGEHMKSWPTRNLWEKYNCIYYVSGLGYNSILDEYKAVVCFVCDIKTLVLIFTSRTRQWREVDVVEDHALQWSIYDFTNVLGHTVNGAPHWLVVSNSKECEIVYFDIVGEKFNKLPTPTMPWWNDRLAKKEMVVMEGCIYVVYNNEGDDLFEFWAMKEYGVTDSWTKLFVIHRHQTRRLTPLGFTNNCDEVVLLINEGLLVTYNLKTEEENTLISIRNKFRLNVAAAYVESLVSPWCNWEKHGERKRTINKVWRGVAN